MEFGRVDDLVFASGGRGGHSTTISFWKEKSDLKLQDLNNLHRLVSAGPVQVIQYPLNRNVC